MSESESKNTHPVTIDYQPGNIENEMITGKAPSFSMFFNMRNLNIFLGSTFITASQKGSISNTLAVNFGPGNPWYLPTDPHILKGQVTKLMTDECSLLWALYQASTLNGESFMKTVSHVNIFATSVVLFKNYGAIIKKIKECKNNGQIDEINKMLNDRRRTPRSCRIIKAVAELPYLVNFYYGEKLLSCGEERFKTVFEDVNGIKLNFWDFKNISSAMSISTSGTKKFAFTDKSAIL